MALKGEIMENENKPATVVIGKKPFGAYRKYTMALIESGKLADIVILARGPKNIYKALSLVEIIRRNDPSIVATITTKSEKMSKDGREHMVTAVEIRFSKK